jgi:hypothetical protein
MNNYITSWQMLKDIMADKGNSVGVYYYVSSEVVYQALLSEDQGRLSDGRQVYFAQVGNLEIFGADFYGENYDRA